MTAENSDYEFAAADLCDDDDAEGDPLLGSVLDERFLINRLLGRGGLSAVYEALHLQTDRTVAVKVLLPHFSKDQLKAKRLQQEARILNHLEHPNIAKVYGFGITETGSVYLTLEHLEGKTLAQTIAGSGLPTDEIIYIFKQIALAVSYAHKRGVVHRDLKPHNVIITRAKSVMGNDVKVLDFGISKLIATDQDRGPSQKLTGTGVLMVTPTYMSPEQAANALPDHRADIYAFGCMLYEALCGHPPFERDSYPEVLAAHLNVAPPPIPETEKPRQALVNAAMKCLEKQPEDRFQDLQQVYDLLEEIEVHGDADVGQLREVVQPRKSFGLPLPLVGAVLIGITVIVFFADAIRSTMVPTPAKESAEAEPLTAIGFFCRAMNLRRQADNEAEANNLSAARQLYDNAAVDFKKAMAAEPAAERERKYLWEYTLMLSKLASNEEEHREVAKQFEECARLDDERLRNWKPNLEKITKDKIRFDKVEAYSRAAGTYMFRIGDLKLGRMAAESALSADTGDGIIEHVGTWPTEMVARYSRQPKRACDYADLTMKAIGRHRWKVHGGEFVPWAEDAILDYLSSGMTARQAKDRVYELVPMIAEDDDYARCKPVLEKHFPDGCEKVRLPSYLQTSCLYPGKIPH